MTALFWCGVCGGVTNAPDTSLFNRETQRRRQCCEGGARGALGAGDDAGTRDSAGRDSGGSKRGQR